MDRWRKQKQIDGQSARSRTKKKKLYMIRWTHIALFLFLLFFPPSLHHSSPFYGTTTLGAKSCWRDSLLPTENVPHKKKTRKNRGERKKGRLSSFVRHLFSSPTMSEQMGMQSTSGYSEPKSHPLLGPARRCVSYREFHSSVSCKKQKHDTGDFHPYSWLY